MRCCPTRASPKQVRYYPPPIHRRGTPPPWTETLRSHAPATKLVVTLVVYSNNAKVQFSSLTKRRHCHSLHTVYGGCSLGSCVPFSKEVPFWLLVGVVPFLQRYFIKKAAALLQLLRCVCVRAYTQTHTHTNTTKHTQTHSAARQSTRAHAVLYASVKFAKPNVIRGGEW